MVNTQPRRPLKALLLSLQILSPAVTFRQAGGAVPAEIRGRHGALDASNRHDPRAITARRSSDSSGRRTHPLLSLTLLHTESHPRRKWSALQYVTSGQNPRRLAGASTPVRGNFVPASFAPDATHLWFSRSATCARAPGLASGPRGGKAERARREGGVVEVRAQPASPSTLPPPDEERRGKGRSKPGPAAHTRSLLVEGGGAEKRGSTATSAGGGEGRKSGPKPTAPDSETPPRPLLPGNSPPPSPAHSPPQPRAAAGSPPPRPAPPPVPAGRRVREALGRELLSGPGHFRGARRVSPPPQEDDVDAEEEGEAAEACCCLAHSLP